MKKELGFIGLGKMGANMVERLLEMEYTVIVHNKTTGPVEKAERKGARGTSTIADLVLALEKPRLVWIMVPHSAVEDVLSELVPLLSPGDTVIDGGNSPYEESVKRAQTLAEKEIRFLDVGVSGGPAGARSGACLMIGGKEQVYREFEDLFRDLAVSDGYGYMGKAGAGHFVKMVHNGIEYGMMQALAEGFHILKCSPFSLRLIEVANLFNHGSVIESRLMGWLQNGYAEHGEDLTKVTGKASASGEGEWTVKAAHELGISDRVIHDALRARYASQEKPGYQGKVISALRNQFGGHSVDSQSK